MREEIILWRSGAFMVSDTNVRTHRVTVSLTDIDVIEVNRPLLIGAVAFAVLLLLLALRFSDVLLVVELLALIGIGGLAVLAGLTVARVQLHSLSIDGIAIVLPIWTARGMRAAIDTAIAGRKVDRSERPRRVSP
jgi:hypothetical protein